MAGNIGRQVSYGIGKETVRNTAVSASTWFKQLGFELNPKSEIVSNDSAWGTLERTNSSTTLRQWAEGTLEHKLTADSAGLVLLGAFGTVSTGDNADSDASVKDHTFTINQDILGQTFTLYRKDDLSTMRYAGARFGQWELAVDLDDYVKFTADVTARAGESTTATPARTDETEFVAKHVSVKSAATVDDIAAASAISSVQSFTLTCNPNIRMNWEAGSGDPESFTSDGYELSFEMERRYIDQTYENAYNNGTALAWELSLVNSDVTIGSAANPGLVLTAPKVNITDWSRSEDLDGPVTETFTGTIHYSSDEAYALKAVLTNTTASY